MSTDADTNAHESQFQNIGDLVERNDETGVMSVESLCMNCHENVCDYTRYDKLHADLIMS